MVTVWLAKSHIIHGLYLGTALRMVCFSGVAYAVQAGHEKPTEEQLDHNSVGGRDGSLRNTVTRNPWTLPLTVSCYIQERMKHVGALQYCFINNTHTNHVTTTQSLTQLEPRKHSTGHRLSFACWTVWG